MKAAKILSSALITMFMGTAMAGDGFQTLNVIQAAPMQDEALARAEGGVVCSTPGASASVNNGVSGGGVALCSSITPIAFFAVANQLPVTAANFLQVIGSMP
jgi:hypothetical protein